MGEPVAKKQKSEGEMGDLQGRCLLAIPKKGRLYERALQLLKSVDIRFKRAERLDIALSENHNLAIVFLPAADIALYVAQGRVDFGITGQDIVQESGVEVEELLRLDFGKCKLCLQAPIKDRITDPQNLVGKRIVTSFQNLATKYFENLAKNSPNAPKTVINYVSGSVEAACQLGLADAVIDLVESGTTMKAAGLEAIATLMETQAVLISNTHSPHASIIKKFKNRFRGVMMAEKYAMIEYNIPRSKLAEAEKITPGQKSPTISSLEDPNWVAVKCMVLRTEAHDMMDRLAEIGGTGIYITDISNCRIGLTE